ncbi:hypothetical protein ccbrp13_14850 [Ktedonobacteria bacterium brp13]|nr:hypothetical protein ccbrp13_14850 [Ktedonobacteria bacterium brp13]
MLSDRFGRRPILKVMAIIFVLGAFGAALSPDVGWLILLIFFRCVMGLGVGASAVVVMVYLAEMAPTEMRGKITSLGQMMDVCGIMIAYLVDYGLSPFFAWRWMIGLGIIPSFLLFGGLYFLPESPRWLVKQGRIQEAAAVFRRVTTLGSILVAMAASVQSPNLDRLVAEGAKRRSASGDGGHGDGEQP